MQPLSGYSIGITAAPRREEFGASLERRGARIVYAPAIQLVPLSDDADLLTATARCLDGPLDYVIVTTGIGFRGWLEAAEGWGLVNGLTRALGRAEILALDAKAKSAIRACGLRESWVAPTERCAELSEHVRAQGSLAGKRIVVQVHGDPRPDLVDALRSGGADVIDVLVYRWVRPDDDGPLRRLVESTAAAMIDAITFTSAPAAISFLGAADDHGCGVQVRTALRDEVVVASVGPVTAVPLLAEGIAVLQPERARLGPLVREIVERVPARRGRAAEAAGHVLDVRGQAVVVDGRYVSLPGTGIALLRELARKPGHVVARPTLLRLLPGDGSDGHAVDVAIGRLRTAIGDPAIIQTVVKRGYRLAVADA